MEEDQATPPERFQSLLPFFSTPRRDHILVILDNGAGHYDSVIWPHFPGSPFNYLTSECIAGLAE
eukprot:4009694-Prymnesium_polylepis.1